MFLCRYQSFDDLFIDWCYLLNSRKARTFDISKLHENQIYAKERPYIEVTPEEANNPMILMDGKWYLNLDAKIDGKSEMVASFFQKTIDGRVGRWCMVNEEGSR